MNDLERFHRLMKVIQELHETDPRSAIMIEREVCLEALQNLECSTEATQFCPARLASIKAMLRGILAGRPGDGPQAWALHETIARGIPEDIPLEARNVGTRG